MFELSTHPTVAVETLENKKFARPDVVSVVVPETKVVQKDPEEAKTRTKIFQPVPVKEKEEVRAIPRGVRWALASAGLGAAFSAAQAILPPLDNLN